MKSFLTLLLPFSWLQHSPIVMKGDICLHDILFVLAIEPGFVKT